MASLNANKVISSLLKKGFVCENTHHHFYVFRYNGRVITRTYSSHNSEDIHDGLINAMRKQCKMDKPFFLDFIECTKTQQDYINVLDIQGLLSKQ